MNIRSIALVAALPTTILLTAAPALAQGGSGGGGVKPTVAACATGNTSLKGKLDDGRLEVEAQLDVNRNGQSWAWTLTDNGVKFAAGTNKTLAPSGAFSVTKFTANRAGKDNLKFTAVRSGDHKSCSNTFTVS
jgi:hypothetical protein